MNSKLVIGCIADDFTGASDAASFLVKAGLRTVLFNGVPASLPDNGVEFDAAVIALKTRTQETQAAVRDSRTALEYLMALDAQHLYCKYCSTFDSTPEGNIGPVMDAALRQTGARASILCPALPVNKRTVKDGCLYVDGIPLHQSSMKDHPLTPMWAADLAELMKPQSRYDCLKIDRQTLHRKTASEIWELIDSFGQKREHFYIIPDYVDDRDAVRISEVFGDMKLLSGGSGILTELGRRYRRHDQKSLVISSAVSGPGIVLAGSCSVATLAQIDHFRENGHPTYKLDPLKLLSSEQNAELIWSEVVAASSEKEVLIYSSDTSEQVEKIQAAGRERVAGLIEQTIAKLAGLAVVDGCTRIIVAGGETSGAVTKALGFDAYFIGDSIAPGVPVMVPLQNPKIRVVLKSGNFGQTDFFSRALAVTNDNSEGGRRWQQN